MKGLGLSAAAAGLMQGYQFADGIRRNKRDEERMDRRDARQAEFDDVRLQSARMGLEEAQLDAPVRATERDVKKQALQSQQAQTQFMDGLAAAQARDAMSGGVQSRIEFINQIGADAGLAVESAEVDPKTGAIKMTVRGKDGKSQTGAYASIDEMDDEILMFSPEIRQQLMQDSRATKAGIAKEERAHKREIEKVREQGKNSARVAQIGADARIAAAEARLEAARDGGLKVSGDPQKRILEYTKLFKGESYQDANGKWRVRTATEAQKLATELVEKEMAAGAGGASRPAASPRPAASGGLAPSGGNADMGSFWR